MYFLWVRLTVSFLSNLKSRESSSAKQVIFFPAEALLLALGNVELHITASDALSGIAHAFSGLSATPLCCGITSPFLTLWILCKYDASIYLKIVSLISDLNYWPVCLLYALDFTIV